MVIIRSDKEANELFGKKIDNDPKRNKKKCFREEANKNRNKTQNTFLNIKNSSERILVKDNGRKDR